MANQPIEIYQYWRSSCSWRIRWAILHKGLTYKSIPVHLKEGKQNQDEYLNINPSGLVPAIRLDSHVFGQSLAILEYLEETYPEKPLLPANAKDRLIVRGLASHIACDIQPVQNLKVCKRVVSVGGEMQAWAYDTIDKGLASFEKLITDQKLTGDFCFGNQLTIADLCLIPQCYNAIRFKVNLEKYPKVQDIYLRCMGLPDCIESSPEKQIDAVH